MGTGHARRAWSRVLIATTVTVVTIVAVLIGRDPSAKALMDQAAACAPCHGGDAPHGLYAVWRRSPWAHPEGGRTCQGCHSPAESAPECGGAWKVVESPHSGGATCSAADLRVTARRSGSEIAVEAAVINTGTGHSLPGSIRHTLAIEVALTTCQRADGEPTHLPVAVGSSVSAQLRPFATSVSTFHLSDPEGGARQVVASLWLEPVAGLTRGGERRHLGTEVVEVVP